MSDAETMTQTAFAVSLGVDKSNVTRWKHAGLVAMDGKRVLVAETRRRLAARGLARPDVAQRFERERTAAHAPPPPPAEGLAADVGMWRDRRIKAEAQRAESLAESERLAVAEKAGSLLAKDDMGHVMRDIGATVRSVIENMPDQVAPLLPGDVATTREILAEHGRVMLGQIEERMRKGGDV